MEVSIKEQLEQVYLGVAELALSLKQAGKQMRAPELVAWINENYYFPNPYVKMRGVPQAAYRRATEEQKEALITVFLDKWGNHLC